MGELADAHHARINRHANVKGQMSPSPALSLRGLTKRYDNGFLALDGLDLDVPDGGFFGLLGPNGAGKTTAVRILATLTTPDEGRAVVAGHDVVREAAGCTAGGTIQGGSSIGPGVAWVFLVAA